MNTNQNDSFERLRNVVARTFKVSPEMVTPQASLGQLPGWDSFGHLTLMMEVEKEFSVHFPTDKINSPKNASEICDLLRVMQAAGNL
ncbi:MAG: acyl carrier protein [Verrucomicrobiota bacterium]|jgi:acyl carrier protein